MKYRESVITMTPVLNGYFFSPDIADIQSRIKKRAEWERKFSTQQEDIVARIIARAEAMQRVENKHLARRTRIGLCAAAAATISAFTIASAVFVPARVDGNSMFPYYTNGESVIANRLANIDRYSTVLVDYNDDVLIKRVIGMPGETVQIIDGSVYIDNAPLGEVYNNGQSTYSGMFDKPITLDDDEYFILGDNRKVSMDSRVLGPVKADDIEGKVCIALHPFGDQ